jgi:ABC-type nickel/cobalt efflux system permease component RcnA
MLDASALLLIAAVAAVGVLHTIVPDHWVPITLIARQRGWSRAETAGAALQAGTGHVLSTLVIALVVWLAGVAAAEQYGHIVDIAASLALIAFGGWFAVTAWPGVRRRNNAHGHRHSHGHDHADARESEVGCGPADEDGLYAPAATAVAIGHCHPHRHEKNAPPHTHLHDHISAEAHPPEMDAPLHQHRHKATGRAALLLILGSSPMVEGIPAFFAAGRYGVQFLSVLAIVFAASTIGTYVLLCVCSTAGLQRVRLGPLERYGEVLSGALISAVGLVFLIWPAF